MEIKLPKKFTSKHLDDIIQKYWDKTIDVNNNEDILFDLSNLEWIAVEEIVFIFAWFRKLVNIDKKFKFKLADFGDVLKEISDKKPIANVSNEKSLNKWLKDNLKYLKLSQKVRTSINLWHRWDLGQCFEPNDIYDYYKKDSNIITDFLVAEEKKDQKRIADGKHYSIIPFKILKNSSDETLFGLRNQLKSKLSKVYSIEAEITKVT